MATDLHIATVGFSVRNWLALKGPLQPEKIVDGLRVYWHDKLDPGEVMRALRILQGFGRVIVTDDGAFAATHPKMQHHRPPMPPMTSEDDPRPWEGWL